MLADEDGNDADLFDILIKKAKEDSTLDAAYKKIIKSIHKTHGKMIKQQMNNTSLGSTSVIDPHM